MGVVGLLVDPCCLHWGRLQTRKGPNLKLGANWERGHKPLPYHPNEDLRFQFFPYFSCSPNGLGNRSSFYSALNRLHSLVAQFQWVMNMSNITIRGPLDLCQLPVNV